MTLNELNTLGEAQAAELFRQCCASSHWVDCMVAARPFANIESLLIASDAVWSHCQKPDYLEAFDAHPKIGDINSLKARYANTQTMAGHEQSGVDEADEKILQALAEGNKQYENQFGYIFIVFATGKSAGEMLTLLEERLKNEPAEEISIAASEQLKITRIRLCRMLKNTSLPKEGMML
ncbi:2-oxo-4-hydroxy-4-carboxy-5-ureidoimidazoline decarboxylase [Endozoicomonas numazuensis]|uniref:2-oxo-4-hydroxy-4-carboxy-5-ureidoimidazoline decarboxylase n=1 Tax=Endozoicomonas numazuensis TaxID=1137799 RepID=UPI0005522153|nr:2-oxo-4-hydroxy-4-carboxy-5-ureidoimidazoline decarboxylase [Endozoicomonas numazuensis]